MNSEFTDSELRILIDCLEHGWSQSQGTRRIASRLRRKFGEALENRKVRKPNALTTFIVTRPS